MVDYVVHGEDVGAAEAREEAAVGAEVFDGGAELGGDRLGFQEEEFLFHERLLLRHRGEREVWIFGRGADDGCDGGGFDHGERSDEFCIGVADLDRHISRCHARRLYGFPLEENLHSWTPGCRARL